MQTAAVQGDSLLSGIDNQLAVDLGWYSNQELALALSVGQHLWRGVGIGAQPVNELPGDTDHGGGEGQHRQVSAKSLAYDCC